MEKSTSKLRRNFYKWHRILGLIALVPIIGWTISGLSHPFMSNWFRPFLPVETYQQPVQSELKPVLSLQQVMDQNHITELRNFGLVSFKYDTYYQILQKDSAYHYYSATDGKLLPNADRDYATYLARYFTQDSTSKIKSVTLQKNFDGQYQPINHLLPVWKIRFDRPDGMDIYIETGQNRMGTFNNHTRKAFLWVFEQLHTWDFLAAWFGDKVRLAAMITVVGVMLLALLSGITVYGLIWNRFKEIAQKRNDKRWIHRYHRKLGLSVSLLMLLFFISAGFHLWVKLLNAGPQLTLYEYLIKRSELKADNLHLPINDSLITKQAIIKIYNKVYYQFTDSKKNILYFNAVNGEILTNGDELYAKYLTNLYRPHVKENIKAIIKSKQIRQFTNEYGFINKRLPVQMVSYPDNDNWYIETSTSKLAAHVAGIDRAEGPLLYLPA
jgi:hypothetical protein